jgi:hypothetical protein
MMYLPGYASETEEGTSVRFDPLYSRTGSRTQRLFPAVTQFILNSPTTPSLSSGSRPRSRTSAARLPGPRTLRRVRDTCQHRSYPGLCGVAPRARSETSHGSRPLGGYKQLELLIIPELGIPGLSCPFKHRAARSSACAPEGTEPPQAPATRV